MQNKKSKKVILVLLICISMISMMSITCAADWTPTGNINLRNVYNITNAPYINGTTTNFTMYYGNGSQLTGVVASPSPHNDLSGLQGGNTSEYYHLNSTVWNRIMTYAYSWVYDLSSYYTSTQVDAINTSVNNYMVVLNTSNNNYILFTNGTMKSYVDAVNLAINNSNNNYALVLNDSNNNYIVYVNGTMKSYVDSQDILFNDSVNNWITQNNDSVNNYILWVNSTNNGIDLTYNATENQSIKNYADFLNTSNNNYIVSANNTLAGWVDNLFVRFTEIVSQVGNWTLDKTNYYTKTDIGNFNASYLNMTNSSYLTTGQWNATNTSYYLVSNPSGFYNSTSNIGNWTSDKPSYTLLSVLNNGSYLNYPWNATNTSIDWISIRDSSYPVACPAGSYVTQINDSITCTTVVETNWNANYSLVVPYTGATGNVGVGVYNLTATWLNGKFNWTSADTWNIFDGYSLTFNESKLSTVYYNATQSQFVVGTLNAGTLVQTQHSNGIYDGITMNFSETSGSPGLDLRINFTGIDSFNRGILRYKTSPLAGAYPIIQMWNYDLGVWEDYPPIAESLTFATITQPVFDSSDHISEDVVQMRIYKAVNGNTNNHYYVDWIAVAKGYGTPSGEEIDPYSWHRNNPSESGNFTTSGNVTADYFFGNGSQLTDIAESYEDAWINGTIYNKTYVDEMNVSLNNYIGANNVSVGNYILDSNTTLYGMLMNGSFLNVAGEYEDAWINETIYNKTEVDDINTSMLNWVSDTFLKLVGGIITGNLSVNGNVTVGEGDQFLDIYSNSTHTILDSEYPIYITKNIIDYYNVSQIEDINTSVTNTFGLYTLISTLVDRVGNWTLDKVNYYTKTETNAINTSVTNALNTKLGISQWNATNISYALDANLVNGSYFNIPETDSLAYNGTLVDEGRLNNGTYVIIDILNNGTYSVVDTDTWVANYSSYSTTADILAFGYYNSTDFIITDYFTKSEILNFDYYNSTDFAISNYYTKTEVNAINTSMDNLVDLNNVSITNTFNLYVLISTLVDRVGNWTLDKVNYYTKTEVNAINVSMKNYVDVQNTSQTNYINVQNTSVTNAIATKLNLAGGTLTGNLGLTTKNITAIDCIIFDSGGKICSGV